MRRGAGYEATAPRNAAKISSERRSGAVPVVMWCTISSRVMPDSTARATSSASYSSAQVHSTSAGIVLIIFFVVYQQVENHVLQPLVYGRTVQLSPLIVLISVLMGAELAGVIGALGAIPIAGAIQVVVVDWLAHRRRNILEPPGPPPSAAELPS